MSTSSFHRNDEQREVLLRERRERLQAEAERDRFFNLSADLLCVMDADGVIRRANPAWETILGLGPAELTGRPLADFVHPNDRSLVAEAFQRLARRRKPASFEGRCRTREGAFRWGMPWPGPNRNCCSPAPAMPRIANALRSRSPNSPPSRA
jgi:PAS domain S-box-containing protein